MGDLAFVGDEFDELDDQFHAAADYLAGAVTSGSSSFTDAVKLQFYGLYKQATVGKCNINRPSFWDMSGRAKWWSGQNVFNMHMT